MGLKQSSTLQEISFIFKSGFFQMPQTPKAAEQNFMIGKHSLHRKAALRPATDGFHSKPIMPNSNKKLLLYQKRQLSLGVWGISKNRAVLVNNSCLCEDCLSPQNIFEARVPQQTNELLTKSASCF